MFLKQALEEAPLGFAPYPFYFMNGPIDGNAWAADVRSMRAQGMGGAFLHPRHGMLGEYLGKPYLKALEEATRAAAEVGFDACLYDENNWPSGTCDGQVTKGRPGFRSQYLACTRLFLHKGEVAELVFESQPVALLLSVPGEDGARDLEQLVEVPLETPEYTLRAEQDVEVFILEAKAGGYVDVTSEKATDRFITLTHRKLHKALGDKLLWKAVPLIFSDEASMLSCWDISDPMAMPWSPALAGAFKKRKGYDLLPCLPALYDNFGPRTAQVRQDYFEVLSSLYVENFWRPQRQWCERHGLRLTGHSLGEEILHQQTLRQGDLFAVLRELHVPGVDNLRFNCDEFYHKIASSVAHQQGKSRVLSESWGASWWDNAFNERKRNLDWQITRGINLIVPHAHYQTVFGGRKREAPPSEFTQQPYFHHYIHFADYARRACYLASCGIHRAEALVLYPTRSGWAHFTPDRRDPLFEVVEGGLKATCTALEKVHLDYDFVDEVALAEVETARGRLVLGEEDYQALVIPPMTTLSNSTLKNLQELASAGARLIAVAPLPWESEQGQDTGFSEGVGRLFGAEPFALWQSLRTDSVKAGRAGSGQVSLLVPPAVLPDAAATEWLAQSLADLLQPFMKVVEQPEGASLAHLARRGVGAEWWFITNLGEGGGKFRLHLRAAGAPVLGDLAAGTVRGDLQWKRLDTAVAEVELELAAGESVALSFEQTVPFYAAPDRSERKVENRRLTDWQVERATPNWARLPNWRYHPERANESADDLLAALGEDWEQLPEGQYIGPVPPPEPIVDALPVRGWFKTTFVLESALTDLQVVVEPLECPMALALNGRVLALDQTGMLDRYFLSAQIGQMARQGVNLFTLVADYSKSRPRKASNLRRIANDLVPEHLRLAGEFALGALEPMPHLARPGTLRAEVDLALQGLAHFSGLVRYKTQFDLDELPDLAVLDLGEVGDTARVFVNGVLVGGRAFRPYRLDVSEWVSKGANSLVVEVANTAANALMAIGRRSGLLGPIELRLEY